MRIPYEPTARLLKNAWRRRRGTEGPRHHRAGHRHAKHLAALQTLQHSCHTACHTLFRRIHMYLWFFRRLVRSIVTSEAAHFSRTSLLVKPFWIALLAHLKRSVHKHLNKLPLGE